MLVVHANWTAGALWIWGESAAAVDGSGAGSLAADDGPATTAGATATAAPPAALLAHPFAVSADELVAALADGGLLDPAQLASETSTITMRLPADDRGPMPSDRLRGGVSIPVAVGDVALRPFAVPAVRVRREETVAALLALEDRGASRDVEFSHALRYWFDVARLVLELLVDQRFVPTLLQTREDGLFAAWQPWLQEDNARARLSSLLEAMPPVSRAVDDDHAGQPWPILDEALRVMGDAIVRRVLIEDDYGDAIEDRDTDEDPHVAWLAALLDRSDVVPMPRDAQAGLLRDVGAWLSELDEPRQDHELRLGFRLDEPSEDDLADVRWPLVFELVGGSEETVRIEAEELWADPAAARATAGGDGNPEELLLAELGRAARLYPRLEDAMTEATPTGLSLTTADASAFLSEFKDLLEEAGYPVTVPSWWGQPAARLGVRLHLEAPPAEPPRAPGDGVSPAEHRLGLDSIVRYRWQVAVGDQTLTMEQFRELARQKAALARLDGRWVELPPGQLAQAAEFLEAEPGGEMSLLEAVRLAHGFDTAQIGLPVYGLDATGWVADLLGASSGEGRMPRLPQPERFVGTLRPYQEVGLSWLAFLDRFGLGTCLADDMGLGKTIQLIALLLMERAPEQPPVGPTLLVVPTSVISNWQREIGRFAPDLTVHVQHGPDRPLGDELIERAARTDVIITTYTLVSRDRETLLRTKWHRVVLDEAQYIKNPPTKQTATIRGLNATRRVALTGTPVENRLSELWSIMEFCNPGYLGSPGEFRRRFAVPIERHREQQRADQLRHLVRPFVLRRLKTDPNVVNDLPACVVTKEFATLTPEQATLYEQTVNSMLGEVGRAQGIQRRGLVLATLVKLKQVCNHPAQLHKDGVDEPSKALLSQRSGKSRRLLQMLEEVVAAGDRALVFTQFRRMGHLLTAMIQHDLDVESMFLHGGTPPARRQQMIDRFQDPKGTAPVFVLSLKAGGIGVNLTAANHVFHYDRWWNPAVENQATDRAFRIGQTRTVHVHKFVCLGTLEERIDEMIEEKTELAKNIIGSGEDWLTELSATQLRELLTLRDGAIEVEA